MVVIRYLASNPRTLYIKTVSRAKNAPMPPLARCFVVHPHLSVFSNVPSSKFIRFPEESFSNYGNLRMNRFGAEYVVA